MKTVYTREEKNLDGMVSPNSSFRVFRCCSTFRSCYPLANGEHPRAGLKHRDLLHRCFVFPRVSREFVAP